MKKSLLTRSLLLVALFFSGSTLLAQTQVCGTVNLITKTAVMATPSPQSFFKPTSLLVNVKPWV